MSKKFYYFKNKDMSLATTREILIEKTRKIHENFEITPVVLIGVLYKIHVVKYSKLAELHAKK